MDAKDRSSDDAILMARDDIRGLPAPCTSLVNYKHGQRGFVPQAL